MSHDYGQLWWIDVSGAWYEQQLMWLLFYPWKVKHAIRFEPEFPRWQAPVPATPVHGSSFSNRITREIHRVVDSKKKTYTHFTFHEPRHLHKTSRNHVFRRDIRVSVERRGFGNCFIVSSTIGCGHIILPVATGIHVRKKDNVDRPIELSRSSLPDKLQRRFIYFT